MNGNSDVKVNGQATVTEDEDEDEDDFAGPEIPPDLEEPPDDEEGRFFGGGITNDTADVLNFIEEREKDDTQVCQDLQLEKRGGVDIGSRKRRLSIQYGYES